MNGVRDSKIDRADIERLLPWYATGKLGRADRDSVAAFVALHPEFALMLATVDAERKASAQANEAIPGPGAASQARLMAHARAEARFSALRAIWSAVEDLFTRPSAKAVRAAAAVGGIMLFAETAIIGTLLIRGGFARPSAASQSLPPADGVFALVRFAEATPFGLVAEALAELDATIVEGPKPGGFFKVRLGPGDMTETARNKRISALRRRRDAVKLVLPSAPRQLQ